MLRMRCLTLPYVAHLRKAEGRQNKSTPTHHIPDDGALSNNAVNKKIMPPP
jgi:hypothetical protein